jgi:hypothetical protein
MDRLLILLKTIVLLGLACLATGKLAQGAWTDAQGNIRSTSASQEEALLDQILKFCRARDEVARRIEGSCRVSASGAIRRLADSKDLNWLQRVTVEFRTANGVTSISALGTEGDGDREEQKLHRRTVYESLSKTVIDHVLKRELVYPRNQARKELPMDEYLPTELCCTHAGMSLVDILTSQKIAKVQLLGPGRVVVFAEPDDDRVIRVEFDQSRQYFPVSKQTLWRTADQERFDIGYETAVLGFAEFERVILPASGKIMTSSSGEKVRETALTNVSWSICSEGELGSDQIGTYVGFALPGMARIPNREVCKSRQARMQALVSEATSMLDNGNGEQIQSSPLISFSKLNTIRSEMPKLGCILAALGAILVRKFPRISLAAYLGCSVCCLIIGLAPVVSAARIAKINAPDLAADATAWKSLCGVDSLVVLAEIFGSVKEDSYYEFARSIPREPVRGISLEGMATASLRSLPWVMQRVTSPADGLLDELPKCLLLHTVENHYVVAIPATGQRGFVVIDSQRTKPFVVGMDALGGYVSGWGIIYE